MMIAKRESTLIQESSASACQGAGGRQVTGAVIPMLALAAMLGMVGQMSLGAFMPAISRDLAVSIPVLGQVTTLAFLGAAVVSLFAGPLSDHYGKRRMLVVGLTAVALSAAGTMLAPSFGWLLAARLLSAVSAGALAGTTLAIAGTLFDGDERRRAMSWIASGLAAGAIAGIPFLTLVASQTSWRGAHGALSGLALLWVLFVLRALPDDAGHDGRIDSRKILAAYRPLLRQRGLLALNGSSAARAIAWGGMLTYFGAFLGNEMGFSTTEIGWSYMIGGVGYFAGTKLAGGRLGGFDPRLANALATACTGVFIGLTFILPAGPIGAIGLIAAASLAGGFGWVTLVTLVSATSDAGQGTTMSLNSAMFQLGSALGALFGGLMLAVSGYALLGVGLTGFALLAASLVWQPSGFALAARGAMKLMGSLITLCAISIRPLTFTAFASLAGLALGVGWGWPLWMIGLAATAPWLPFFTAETIRASRAYGWLALFYILIIAQGGHVLEHTAQMIQIHLPRLSPPHTHGIFGQLDIEWVHFGWNSLVLAAILVLIWRFPANRWLLVAFAFAAWHQAEHSVIMARFLTTGTAGTPGLLATGGHLGGGLPVSRPDLHFLYNVIETTPLLIAYLWQVRRTLRGSRRATEKTSPTPAHIPVPSSPGLHGGD